MKLRSLARVGAGRHMGRGGAAAWELGEGGYREMTLKSLRPGQGA
ncbi:hypothetical protein GLA29479_1285 [Lysobacter antibioticus]|uniref:Uncharacterized protein n=1 Tax=Lysobacter antibioticus TaxID=84531 RepID=A0A0S2DUK3_LYSAN|nr:hypothetical protein GLA29479_1285 [Lysobacter antibioticus]ALN78248.1 hypothetical protein LA76x_0086 [Lysobacter antibioticus]